jgi:hypothetical protein
MPKSTTVVLLLPLALRSIDLTLQLDHGHLRELNRILISHAAD